MLALFQRLFTELFKEIISLNLMSCQNDFYFRVSLPGIILLLLFIVVVLICFYFRKNIWALLRGFYDSLTLPRPFFFKKKKIKTIIFHLKNAENVFFRD